jgi:putative transposase
MTTKARRRSAHDRRRDPKQPALTASITSLFTKLIDRDRILARAYQLGAIARLRAQHPLDVMLALVRCAVGDEHRSVATARRQFQDLTGVMPEESSFYDRLTPGLADLGWEMFLQVLARANRVQRKAVARALGVHVRDIRVVDGSSVTLPHRAAAHFPATDSKLGGFKLTTTLSLLEDLVVNVRVTDARQHDRKAFELPTDVRSVLWLMDRGYSDHKLFAQIDHGKGSFIIRLKSTSQPVVTAIRSGLAKAHQGQPLSRALPYFGVVDVDARFTVGRGTRIFRVVGIPVADTKQGEPDWVWLATNLPPRVAAPTVGAFYRLRWTIETLFRILKSVGRLDELRSGNPAVVQVFIAATLIGLALSHALCALLRAARPGCDPSLYRVFALLLTNLGRLVDALANGTLPAVIPRFIEALWREGLNPNPGRPYARERHLATVGK